MTSEIKVNNIKKASGSTITIGESGDTISLASGASQSGFGRSGTVDWQTSIKTSTFTASNGEGYFVNTSGGAVTVNLPAGTTGAIVSIKDYAQTFDTNNCTISADGSEKIEGQTFDLILDTEGIATTLVYGDATKGWQSVNSNEVTNVTKFVTATGGTVTCSGNFKIHTFTSPGTFCVSCAGNPSGSTTVDYLVIAGGGGGGGKSSGGGGGAGGYRFSNGTASGCYTAGPSPLGASALPITATGFPITVGAGGTINGNPAGNGDPGSNSIFSSITSTGGGAGKANPSPCTTGSTGGSGGGGGGPGSGGAGNTPPVSPPQGNNGGSGASPDSGGGGGGAGGTGGGGNGPTGGNGGAGLTSCITASPVARGGGGAGRGGSTGGTGGTGGGGTGAAGGSGDTPGTANTGGGGGGSGSTNDAGTGGSGIVIIRYKFQ